MLDSFSLAGKNALVTGSQQGLGAGIAMGLAEAGANVVCHGLSPEPNDICDRIRALGRKSLFVAGDVSDKKVCEELVERTVLELGSIDILVNNAGTIKRAPAAEFPDDYWDQVIAVNLSSVFRLSKLAGQHMLKQGKGKIVNIASLLSFQGGVFVPSYTAAKSGVAGITKALANEWAPKGLHVNAIAPGYMATDNTAPLRADKERSRQLTERIPAGRWGEPCDLMGAAVFLSSAASDYVNGHVLVVDGGWLAR
ncbi:MAG TPA: 2-dehydro-3-deoxy-D-gluconate 5-dehydrogenase KduD [Clostridia bacterium]|nr:2-dehydro-3-deoxy-D-gluconate 5-dehydrogenase KduD [Clostridia bacterium]